MWFRRTFRRRRIEGRRGASGSNASAWRRFWQAGGVGATALAVMLFAGVLAMDLTPPDPPGYRKGQFAARDIYPRVPFQVKSEALLKKETDWINNSMPASFVLNTALVDKIAATLKDLPERLTTASQPADVPEKTRAMFGLNDPDALAQWRQYAEPAAKQDLASQIEKLRSAMARTFIVRSEEAEAQRGRSAREFKAVFDNQPRLESVADLVGLKRVDRIADMARNLADIFDAPLRLSVRQYLLVTLGSPDSEPVYVYDPMRTEKERDQAIAQLVAHPPPSVFDSYGLGDVLVAGSRMTGADRIEGLTDNDLKLLRAEHSQYLRDELQFRPWQFWGRLLGRAMLLLMVTAVLCIYMMNYRPGLVRNRWQALSLTAAILLLLGVNKLLVAVLGLQTAMLPVLMAAIGLVIAYDRRFAWVVGTVFSIFIVLQNRSDLLMFLVFLIAMTVVIVQLGEIRSRSKLVVASLTTTAVTFLAGLSAWLVQSLPWQVALRDCAWLAGSALLAGFFAQGLLPLIERVFGVATSMTLLEWGDASKPVLKRLAIEAPGTYNHSLQLAALCEAAAESIGARGLLARVGAYYHDIGKIHKPDYFIENQAGSPSRHAKLSPAMSLLIIIGHVKDGLELAREYGLPRVLHEFIATHHGTTLVQFFYQAAAEKRKSEADRAPDEVEFRYPGPKPHSREAAILMLADAAESSVRAMTDRTPGRIENQVHTMVSRRLMDAQLGDCELTLHEVNKIEMSLIKNLTSMYHLRVAYPTPPGQKPSAGELQAARKEEERANGKPQQQPQGM